MTAEDVERKRRYALAVVFLLLIAAICFPFHLRFIVDVFAIGLSNAKLYGFPLFALIMLLSYFRKPKDDAGFKRRALRVGAVLAILFTASLASFLYVTKTIGASGLYRYYVVRDGFLSSNYLSHIHSFKPIVGWPLEFFSTMSYTLDYGYPFMAYIPFYAYIPLSMLLLYLLYQLWEITSHIGQRANYSVSWFFVLAVSVFTIVKNIIDGGVLCPQLTIPMGIFAYLLLLRKETSEWRRILLPLAAVTIALTLQVFIQLLVTAYLGGGITAEMAYVLTALALTDENIPTTGALLLIVYASFKLLDRKPTPLKLAVSIILFALLFSLITWAISIWPYNASPISFSSALLANEQSIIPVNTSVALLAKPGSHFENDFFAVTNSESLRRHDLVWGYTLRAVSDADVASLSGEPPGRKILKINCPYQPLEHNDTLLVKLYGYDGLPQQINSTLMSIEKTSRRQDEYYVRISYCTPGKLIILMDVLALNDDVYAIEPVVMSPSDLNSIPN
jgi:hypothetical protein